MPATPSFEGILPQQESRRIIQDVFPERASIDDFQNTGEAVPAPVANNSKTPTVVNPSQSIPERGRSETLRVEKRGMIISGGNNGGSLGSSDTLGDEEKREPRAQDGSPLGRDSDSTIVDSETQGRGAHQNDSFDRARFDSSRDLEKGKTGPKEHDGVHQDDEHEIEPQWENNVVGWDGPNDPQNPHNWKKSKKYTVTVFYSSMTFCITFASSVFSTATTVTAQKYGVSDEVMTLGTSVFVFVSAAHSQHHQPKTDKNNRASRSAQ